MNKKAQFFILSAVIIASIVVGMATVRNSVNTGAAPAKFYYYSQQLNEETGAVVDFALYNSGENARIEEFLQSALEDTLSKNPGMDAFSCWTREGYGDGLFCQNDGAKTVSVTTDDSVSSPVNVYGKKDPTFLEPISCRGARCIYKQATISLSIREASEVIISDGENTYNVPVQNSTIQSGQFYFILKTNSSSGTYISSSSN